MGWEDMTDQQHEDQYEAMQRNLESIENDQDEEIMYLDDKTNSDQDRNINRITNPLNNINTRIFLHVVRVHVDGQWKNFIGKPYLKYFKLLGSS